MIRIISIQVAAVLLVATCCTVACGQQDRPVESPGGIQIEARAVLHRETTNGDVRVVENVELRTGASGWTTMPLLKWHKGEILDATYLKNGNLATLSPKGEVQIWNDQTGEMLQSLGVTQPTVVKLLGVPDGSRLLGFTRSGAIQQWALPAPKRSWGPEQALGPPDSGTGDEPSAWASLSEDDQDEWMVLEYAAPVKATMVHVYENHNPGALIRVTTFGADQKKLILWDGKDPVVTDNGRHVARLKVIDPEPVQRIKLYLDSTKVQGWNEIDAVGLEDETGRIHWATAAGASSTYATRQVIQRGVFRPNTFEFEIDR